MQIVVPENARVVLDTNILVSALLQPQSLPARVFLTTIAGNTLQLCESGEIYAEYEEVLRRPRFNRTEAVIEHTIRQNGFWVRPSEQVRACSDPDDNIFLECAQVARARPLSRHRKFEALSCEMGRHAGSIAPAVS